MALIVIGMTIYPVGAMKPPTSPGQPDQSCQDFFTVLIPRGFNTFGFNDIAVNRYAGSGFVEKQDNPLAVSQYDVACFQQAVRLGLIP